MGGLWFDPETLADSLSETAGYKAGLALSLDTMCDHQTPLLSNCREAFLHCC